MAVFLAGNGQMLELGHIQIITTLRIKLYGLPADQQKSIGITTGAKSLS